MDTVATAPAETGHVLVIERVFDAPPALVFRLWSDPARVKEWWHPKDFVTPSFEMDFREGGAYPERRWRTASICSATASCRVPLRLPSVTCSRRSSRRPRTIC